MAIGYAEGSIAGVALEDGSGTPCKVLLLDAGNFLPTITGNTQQAADGTPYTQILTVSAGRAFGVKIEFCPPDVLNSIIDAINLALSNGDTFTVILDDDLTSINAECLPDFASGFLKIEPQRTHPDVIKGIELRLMTSE